VVDVISPLHLPHAMKHDACLEYARLKDRQDQCLETSTYLTNHPEEEELTTKRAAERYHQRYIEAHAELLSHAKSCPVCRGQTGDWT